MAGEEEHAGKAGLDWKEWQSETFPFFMPQLSDSAHACRQHTSSVALGVKRLPLKQELEN